MPFTVSALLFAAFLAAGAYVFGVGVVRWPDLYLRLPRARVSGELLGIVCLAWATYHICPMLEGDLVKYRVAVKLLVPVVAVLGFYHLDYLLARSLGGFLLLCLNHLLHAAFTAHVPGRPVLAIVCYLLSFVGLVFTAAPWRFRDLLEKASKSSSWRRSAATCFAAASALFVVYAFLP